MLCPQQHSMAETAGAVPACVLHPHASPSNAALHMQRDAFHGTMDINDLFGEIFGNGSPFGGGRAMQGADITARIS